jgi:hypothetical protein
VQYNVLLNLNKARKKAKRPAMSLLSGYCWSGKHIVNKSGENYEILSASRYSDFCSAEHQPWAVSSFCSLNISIKKYETLDCENRCRLLALQSAEFSIPSSFLPIISLMPFVPFFQSG